LNAYRLNFAAFMDAILKNRPPSITGWDGRQAVAAAMTAYESSRTGREVVLAPEGSGVCEENAEHRSF